MAQTLRKAIGLLKDFRVASASCGLLNFIAIKGVNKTSSFSSSTVSKPLP
jgi:hypothetical protein